MSRNYHVRYKLGWVHERVQATADEWIAKAQAAADARIAAQVAEAAEGSVEALEKRVADLVEEGKGLQVKRDAEHEETTALRMANSALKDDISSLREEKARLAGLLEHATHEAVPKK